MADAVGLRLVGQIAMSERARIGEPADAVKVIAETAGGYIVGEAERVRLETECLRLEAELQDANQKIGLLQTALREADEHLKVDSLGVGLARTIISEAIADSGTGERITHGRHCTCSACAREDWSRITAPCGMHGEACPAVYAPLGSAGSWSVPGSTGDPENEQKR